MEALLESALKPITDRAARQGHPASQRLGGLDVHRVMEGDQGLQRCVGALTPNLADLAIGCSEGGHPGGVVRAAPTRVQARA